MVCGSIVVRVGGNVLFVGQGAVADAQAGGQLRFVQEPSKVMGCWSVYSYIGGLAN